MIKMIGNLTHCDIRVGQNGLVVLAGPPEGVVKAVEAVELIEQEAHMADLTQKVEMFLAGPGGLAGGAEGAPAPAPPGAPEGEVTGSNGE